MPGANGQTKPDYVYSLHGIRTNAFWQSQIADEVHIGTNFEVGARNYRRFDLFMFVLKDIFYFQPLRLVETDLKSLQERHRVSVIAHSFGTWLLLKALKENPKIKIHHVILCGGIFPRAASDWRQLKQDTGQITGEIVNFCGTRDPFPALAELLSRDFGASGVVGAGDPFVEDSFHDVGHSGFLTRTFCREHWLPILLGRKHARRAITNPRGWVSALLWISAHRGAAAFACLLAGTGTYYFYGLEYSCYVRSCFVDIVRIHNYSSSTREVGSPRSYVDQVTFEYRFNYNLDEYPFRAAADRKPVVTSLLGEQLTPLPSTESSDTVTTADGVRNRKWENFRIPVVGRRAYFAAEFANQSSEAPAGLTIFAAGRIRNFRGQIILPPDVSLVAPRGEFRQGILVDGVLQNESYAKRCDFSTDGSAIRCTGLDLPANHEFFYCFEVKGWNKPDQISTAAAEGCGSTAIPAPVAGTAAH